MTDLPRIDQDPCEAEFVNNPYARYQNWRDAPFYYWQQYRIAVSARYEIVNQILRDRRFGREAPQGFAPEIPPHLKVFYDFEANSMLEREPPTHTRLRSLVLRSFTSRRIQSLEGEISALCDELIRQFPKGEFNLLTQYAEPIPVLIIARMIGVPDDMAPQLLKWSHDMVAMYQAGRSREIEESAVAATLAFSDYIREIAKERRINPQNDLISSLLAVEAEGDKLNIDELITTVILLLNAGHEATVHAISNGVYVALQNGFTPNEANLASAIEEMLRIDPPLHMFTRYAMEDIEIAGYQFQKGEQIGLLLGAANHDPAHYPRPEIFDPNRNASDHTSFGAGLHFCIGAPLARLEMKIAIAKLFEYAPKLALAKKPQYANRYHFHGLEDLWVTI